MMNTLPLIATLIGSRETPETEQNALTIFAQHIQHSKGVVRSGGARGADQAAEKGITDARYKEIYLPYSKAPAHQDGVYVLGEMHRRYQDGARTIAQRFHPNWTALQNKGQAAEQLMTRNVFQILGMELRSPSDIVVMWAKGSRTGWGRRDSHNRICDVPGGTGLAVRLAHSLHIPVLHTSVPEHQLILQAYQQGHFEEFHALLWNEGKWERSACEEAVEQLRQSVGLTVPAAAPSTNRWKRTPYRP